LLESGTDKCYTVLAKRIREDDKESLNAVILTIKLHCIHWNSSRTFTAFIDGKRNDFTPIQK